MYKLCFYVPEPQLETVKSAVFAAGAGTRHGGQYEQCCWQTPGQGQFKPLAGSMPTIGSPGVVSHVAEFKVEMICEDQHLGAAVDALRSAHPYEDVALDIWRLEELP